MPRWTRQAALFCAALLLTACDAGHKDNPGADNTWSGPELAIQLPGPSTTVRIELDEAGWEAYKAGKHDKRIRAMVHLRALNAVDNVVVRYAVDDGPFKALPKPTEPFDLPKGLAPGTHLLSAYVANKAGEPYPKFGPKGAVVAEFHVQIEVTRADGTVDTLGGESNTYGHQKDGVYQPYDRNAPQLLVERRGATVNALVVNGRLDEETLRLRWGDETATDGHAAAITLEDASSPITLTLETKVDDEWVRVDGARASWPMPRQ